MSFSAQGSLIILMQPCSWWMSALLEYLNENSNQKACVGVC